MGMEFPDNRREADNSSRAPSGSGVLKTLPQDARRSMPVFWEVKMLFAKLSFHQRSRRGLASAFIGEIAAAMDAVQKHTDLRHTEDGRGPTACRPPELRLPKFAVYEANANRLGLFNEPLPQELSYFYTRLAALPLHLRALDAARLSSAGDDKRKNQDWFGDIADTMQLGEDLLRRIRASV